MNAREAFRMEGIMKWQKLYHESWLGSPSMSREIARMLKKGAVDIVRAPGIGYGDKIVITSITYRDPR